MLRGKLASRSVGGVGLAGSVASIVTLAVSVVSGKAGIAALGYSIFALSFSVVVLYEMRCRAALERRLARMQEKYESERRHLLTDRKKLICKAKELLENVQKYGSACKHFHYIFHHLREADLLLRGSRRFGDAELKIVMGSVSTCITHLSKCVGELFGCECNATIKICKNPNGNRNPDKVITYARDSQSPSWRWSNDNAEYNVFENTAFTQILCDDKVSYFNDNLDVAFENRSYINKNPVWLAQRHYKTTAVVAIQAIRKTDKNECYTDVLGFLCIDAAEPKAFSNDPTESILLGLADSLYCTLRYLKLREAKQRRS